MERYLLIVKKNHKYFFSYRKGNEKNLFFSLLECARSGKHNLALLEVLKIIRKISGRMNEESAVLKIQLV